MPKKSSSKTTKPGLQNPNVATWDMSNKTSAKPSKPVLQKPTLKKEKPSSTPTRYGQEIDEIFCKKRNKPEQNSTSKLTKKPRKDLKDDESVTRKKRKSKSGGSNVDMFENKETVTPRRKTGDGLTIYTEEELGFGKADTGGNYGIFVSWLLFVFRVEWYWWKSLGPHLLVALEDKVPTCSHTGQLPHQSSLTSGTTGRTFQNLQLDTVQNRSQAGKTLCSAEACIHPLTAIESHSHVDEDKVGVLLLNLGGPDTLNDVQPFLYNLFADPDIIRLPRLFRFLQRPLARLISTLRAPKSKEGYASIGGGSPLRKITDEQADALKLALEAKKVAANVYVAMRYWHPFTEEAVQQIKRDNIKKLVVLPLYPQYSISTTGSSVRVLQNLFRDDNTLSRLPVAIIQSWYQRGGYVKSMANLIQKELQTFGSPEEVMIFFSAHGVPVSYVRDAGDPYKDQMEDCIYLIMQELKARGINNDHKLAYQSRVGPVQWLKPYTDEVLVELGKSGVKSLLAVPVSFVSEHIETLEEIDMEYKELALESGVENWGRVPALGCTSTFITDLADAVIEALPSAEAMTTCTTVSGSTSVNQNTVGYAIKMILGSFLAFIVLLVFPAFKSQNV
ncbi:ferrochelatase-1, chloroplastic/mitochondrial-like [Bidens hawaiensis]|uniref:ferrochelatase-1, chloroplastic/mitochondrial-like n=1 Tax=Bidens hawaiensis TaxID=980011 RepID=UPI0040496137